MTRRYYVPDLPGTGGLTELPRSESAHAIRVMRIQLGDSVTLFDGRGNESQAVVAQIGRDQCHCDAQRSLPVDREPAHAIHLGIALPKPDRARELILRLTELGVRSVTPLVANRTQRPPSESQLEKLRRAVIEACKQCGRNQILEILPTQPALEYFAGVDAHVRLIAHRSDDASSIATIHPADEMVAAIGPEGGWSSDEVRLAIGSGFQAIGLGPRVLRIETAATVVAAVFIMQD